MIKNKNLINKKRKIDKFLVVKYFSFFVITIALVSVTNVYATDDPLAVINNLSNFIFSLVRGVGIIILTFAIVQIGLSIKSHDPTQRANGFLTLAGGVVIAFAQEILKKIMG